MATFGTISNGNVPRCLRCGEWLGVDSDVVFVVIVDVAVGVSVIAAVTDAFGVLLLRCCYRCCYC